MKDKIPLSSVSDGIWSEPGNSKEFYIGNGDETAEQAAGVNSRADRLRSSVIHEQKHFLGEKYYSRGSRCDVFRASKHSFSIF